MDNIYNFQSYITKLNEGLIVTYPISKTINDIEELISSYNIKYNITKYDNKFKIELDNINTIINFEKILNKFTY